jgi:hypothetical protein
MKPGDLVKLTNYSPSLVTWGVKVSWWDAQQEREGVFDPGTPCVFLGSSPSPSGEHTVSAVLIRGRVGWVWPEELDPL